MLELIEGVDVNDVGVIQSRAGARFAVERVDHLFVVGHFPFE